MQATKQLNLRLPEELVFWIKSMAKKKHQFFRELTNF